MRKNAVILIIFLLLASVSSADIYKYVDENGVVCYTDTAVANSAVTVYREENATTDSPEFRNRYSNYIQKAASKYQIEPSLINAVIKTESNWNHRAVSRKGAIGLMQLMPSTARDMQVGNPFNPEENIEGGTKYLRLLLEKFNGDLRLALAAYNAGPKRVEEFGTVPPITETRDYVAKVFSLYEGKRNYSFSDFGYGTKSTRIFKVTLEDGTILFTNSPFAANKNVRF